MVQNSKGEWETKTFSYIQDKISKTSILGDLFNRATFPEFNR